jgi:putative ABC transport system substrate-binding protein
MSICLRRREFIAGLGGAVAWPLAARAQQGNPVRRIGVLMAYDENDPLVKTGFSEFAQALADLGWVDGRNLRMDVRSAGGDINRIRALALVGLQPDIILTVATGRTARPRLRHLRDAAALDTSDHPVAARSGTGRHTSRADRP